MPPTDPLTISLQAECHPEKSDFQNVRDPQVLLLDSQAPSNSPVKHIYTTNKTKADKPKLLQKTGPPRTGTPKCLETPRLSSD